MHLIFTALALALILSLAIFLVVQYWPIFVVLSALFILYLWHQRKTSVIVSEAVPQRRKVTVEIQINSECVREKVFNIQKQSRNKILFTPPDKCNSSVTTHGTPRWGRSIYVKAPTRGLVIAERPLNQILSGNKTLELRGTHNRKMGPVALIKKGSKQIFGLAEIVESIGPMSREELRDRQNEHGVESGRIEEVFQRGWVFGWRMTNIITLNRSVPYVHKGMSQVNLNREAIDEIQVQLDVAASKLRTENS